MQVYFSWSILLMKKNLQKSWLQKTLGTTFIKWILHYFIMNQVSNSFTKSWTSFDTRYFKISKMRKNFSSNVCYVFTNIITDCHQLQALWNFNVIWRVSWQSKVLIMYRKFKTIFKIFVCEFWQNKNFYKVLKTLTSVKAVASRAKFYYF